MKKRSAKQQTAVLKKKTSFFFRTFDAALDNVAPMIKGLKTGSWEKAVPLAHFQPPQIIAKARSIWPLLSGETYAYILDHQDLLRRSFLSNARSFSDEVQLDSIGFLLTLHAPGLQSFFRPTSVEILTRLMVEEKTIEKKAKAPVICFDVMSSIDLIAKARPDIAPQTGRPVFFAADIAGRPAHLCITELFTGDLPETLAERTVVFDGKKYGARHAIAQIYAIPPYEPSPLKLDKTRRRRSYPEDYDIGA